MALSRGQSRALAVVLAVAVGAGLVRGLGLPLWRTYTQNRLEIEQQRDHIFRFTRMAASLESLKREVARLEEARDANRQILPESNPTFAAATLQERVKSVVTASGGKLTSTQVLPVVDEGAFTRVTVAVRMSVTEAALQQVLYGLEAGQPYLLVDKLMVIARQVRRPRARPGRRAPARPVPGPRRSLDIRFNLSGYLRPAPA